MGEPVQLPNLGLREQTWVWEMVMQSRNKPEAVWHLVQQGLCDSDDVWTAVRQCVDCDELMDWVQASLDNRARRPLHVDWDCVLDRLVTLH